MGFWIIVGIIIVIAAIYLTIKEKSEKNTSSPSNSSAYDITTPITKPSTKTHIIGVRFENQSSGCYYYIGNNALYNLNDKVEVPTKNGNKTATVVFKKIYESGETLPYPKNQLKTVIGKVEKIEKPAKTTARSYADYDDEYSRVRNRNYDYDEDGNFLGSLPEEYYSKRRHDDYDSMDGYYDDAYSIVPDGFHLDDDGNWEPDDVYDNDDW